MSQPDATTSDPLLLEFAATKPQEFAALLAAADFKELLELLGHLPWDTTARLAANLPSRQLLRLLSELSAEQICELLLAADHDDSITLASHLNEIRYSQIISAAPPDRRKILLRLFNFPKYSLAALASTNFIRVDADTSCESFLSELKSHTSTGFVPIYVVESGGIFLGVLNPVSLVSNSNHGKNVREITIKLKALSGQMAASTALKSTSWSRYSSLPVVDTKKRLVGSISLDYLQKIAKAPDSEAFGFEQLLSEAMMQYLRFCAHTLELLFLGKSK